MVSVDTELVRVEPGATVELMLELERTGDWKNRGPVSVEASELPEGLSMEAVTVPSDESTAVVTLRADSNANKGVFPCALLATPAETDVAPAEQTLDVVIPGAPGELDRSFDFDGQLAYGETGQYYVVVRGNVDAAGRLWLLYNETNSGQSGLLRILADGSLDSDFALTYETLRDELGIATAYEMQPLSDGRLVMGASFKDDADVVYNALLMLTEEIELDPTFGDGGEARVDVLDEAFGILLRRDDILLKQRGTWASFLYSGKLNTDFFETGVDYVSDYYSKGVVRDDDSLLALTYTNPPEARLISNNEITPLPGTYNEITSRLAELHNKAIFDYKVPACIPEPDQVVVCCGYYRTKTDDGSSPPWHAYVFRLDAEANLDPDFGVDGFIRKTSASGQINNARSIVHDEGRLVVGYEYRPDAESVEYSIACYDSDGQTCSDFGASGRQEILGPPQQMAVDKYGRLWAWGAGPSLNLPDDQTVIHIARLWL